MFSTISFFTSCLNLIFSTCGGRFNCRSWRSWSKKSGNLKSNFTAPKQVVPLSVHCRSLLVEVIIMLDHICRAVALLSLLLMVTNSGERNAPWMRRDRRPHQLRRSCICKHLNCSSSAHLIHHCSSPAKVDERHHALHETFNSRTWTELQHFPVTYWLQFL